MFTNDGFGEMWDDEVVVYCKGLSSRSPGETAIKRC
jgi:hypothetical protein